MKLTTAVFDPIPLDAPPAPGSLGETSHATLELLRPFLKASGGIVDAIKADCVSVHDHVLIKRCLDNVKDNQIVTDPFGLDYEDENFRILRIMAEKYAFVSGAPRDDVLQKTSGGDRVDNLIKMAIDGLRSGKNIVMPSECRIAFARVPDLQALVAKGRICFDYAG